MASLQAAATDAGVDVLTDARVTSIIADDAKRVRGVEIARPDGSTDRIGCDALILAWCGFAGNAQMVARYMLE